MVIYEFVCSESSRTYRVGIVIFFNVELADIHWVQLQLYVRVSAALTLLRIRLEWLVYLGMGVV